MSRYAEILLPLPLKPLTYEVDSGLCLCVGDAVAAVMGQHSERYYTGIVLSLHDERPAYDNIRKIEKKLYDRPLISLAQKKFWEWLADYYLSSLGEVMRCALPAMVKPSGIDSLAFEMAEYKPRKEWYVRVNEGEAFDSERVEKLARRSQAQADMLAEIIKIDKNAYNDGGEFPRRLLENGDLVHLRALEKKGFLSLNERERQSENLGHIHFHLPQLTAAQQSALEQIKKGHEERPCALLHGVTGSGKSEIYMQLIAETLAQDKDVLMLLPEIALTTQLISRMEKVFGSRVVAYHSKIAARRRTEIYFEMGRNAQGGQFILGARSAIFLPFNNLGLIVVDEEHDSSYKQADPAPRYNARDAAHILAAINGAKVLLGSATPSLESWVNGLSEKFTLVKLTERFAGASLPEITISDTRKAVRRGERRGHFNSYLLQKIEERAERGEQAMLLQNRRGYAPYIECGECGWVARCPNCNVSLTMHKRGGRLVCHYCDYFMPTPSACPSCKALSLKPMGFGTEKIEEQLQEFLPSIRTSRMDRDTANSPRAAEQIIAEFGRGESDVLVGTQMIAKGLDFAKVTLVGVLNADNILLAPDFRSEERAFSLVTQVAGRAGRRQGAQGEVVIQSSQPEHRIMPIIQAGDYEAMARTLLPEREAFFYPPYSRIIAITLKHKDVRLLNESANALSATLRTHFAGRVRGPVPPPIDRILGEWIVSIIVKIESGTSSQRAKGILREIFAQWQMSYKPVKLSCDVDPQ